MKIFYGINKVKGLANSVVAIGVFDGIHRGHRRVLKAAVKKAIAVGSKSVVLTFWPHPQREKILYSLEHRLRLMADLGINVCIVARLNNRISSMSPKDFISDVLCKRIRAGYVYVGKDFKFGRGAGGNFSLLKKLGVEYGLKARGFDIVKSLNRPISSTLIRGLIAYGDIKTAGSLLGRKVSILGTVIRGRSLGKSLGFPTANIDPHHEVIPPSGIYAVRIIFNGRAYKGICYIGIRSTITAAKKINIEVHIFNFSRTIYGEYLEIQFLKRIRADMKFPSLRLLAKQIKKDIVLSKKIAY